MAKRIAPAMMKRMPAISRGGIVSDASRMNRYVLPQMTYTMAKAPITRPPRRWTTVDRARVVTSGHPTASTRADGVVDGPLPSVSGGRDMAVQVQAMRSVNPATEEEIATYPRHT